ncbi:MAG TPA: FHA domain-containing protein, partial [Streptomyces sp.]
MTAAAELCPECGTPREGAALFCEECRYNFRTHSATTFVAPPPPPTAPGFPPYQRYESQRSRPSQVNRPAEPVPDASVTVTSGSGDFLLDPPSTPVAPAPPVAPVTPIMPAPAPPVAPVTPVAPAEPEERMAPVVQLPLRPREAAAGSGAREESGPGRTAAGRGTAWVAVIAADREYFTTMMARSGPEAQGLYFPAFSPEQQLPLIGNQITIGRRRHSTGEAPDIDLSRSPEDPGVSHQHA